MILLVLEALWFAAGLYWTSVSHVGINGLGYPGSWQPQVVELAVVQAASMVALVVFAAFVARGSNVALTLTLIVASAHVFIQVAWSLFGFLLFPYYLLAVTLPFNAPFVLAAPLLILCMSTRKARSLELHQ